VPNDFTMRGGGGGADGVDSGGGGCLPNGASHSAIKYNVNLQHFVIREKRLSERNALEVFYNVVKVVERLHNRNVVHRDLKVMAGGGRVSVHTYITYTLFRRKERKKERNTTRFFLAGQYHFKHPFEEYHFDQLLFGQASDGRR
jgi:hypothetical protein